ncbi:MAG: hypothetical protein AAB794_04365 [Patescibacteria group bacterium]
MDLLPVVENILSKRDFFLALTQKHNTPFYTYDQKELDESIGRFMKAFQAHVPRFQAYYAVKLNHHPLVVKRVVEKGLGLDVASRRELSMAINAGATEIVYFSPGKSEEDLTDAIIHSDIVRLNIDSFNELRRLGVISNKMKRGVDTSIRVHLPSQGSWTKYGIPLNELKVFWEEATQYPFVRLNGIHFHQSRNRTTDFYTDAIREIGEYIGANLSVQERALIKYIDFGGGFEPYKSEGVIVQNESNQHDYRILETPTIEEYAKAIGVAITKYLNPLIEAAYFAEPGRYICNSAMHIVLSVADVKDAQNVILNGGVNMVGWQRFESEYFPLINLSSPAKTEIECNLWGNLCTTWDIWGYHCFADSVNESDIIIVPYQGALTYSLAQSFISDIPPVIPLY